MRKVSFIMVVSTLLLPACGSKLPSVKPFSMDVQQGNVVDSKMLLQLRPGMTRSQVRYIMGTPLVVDTFHDNRWYYSYAMRKGGQLSEKRSVILDFEKDTLLRVRGDVVPEGDPTAKIETVTQPVSVAKAPEPTEKTWLQKLKFWGGDEAAQSVTPEVVVEDKQANQDLKVAPELVAESASKESVVPQVATVAATVVDETKTVEATAETKDSEVSEKSWWQKLKFWGDDEPVEVAASGSSPEADVAPAAVVEEKPAVIELKATPEPVVETASKETVAPEAVAALAVAETKSVENVVENNTTKAEDKSWWERFKFWGKDKPADMASVEQKPEVPELKATPEPVVEATSNAIPEVVTATPPVAEVNPAEQVVVTSVPVITPVKEALSNAKEEIATAVASWAEAWRNKDLKAYLAKYADDFKPDSLPNKKAWEAQRKQRLSPKQGNITLDISDVQVQQNGNKVAVKFKQKYASKVYSDQVTKQLDLRLDPTTKKWLIVRETATPAK